MHRRPAAAASSSAAAALIVRRNLSEPAAANALSTSSDVAATTAAATPHSPPPPIVWTTHRLSQEQIQKVDAIFHKILWLDMIETSLLTDQINQKLGLTLTPLQQTAITRHLEQQHTGDQNASKHGGAAAAAEDNAAPVIQTVDLKLVGYDDAAKIKVIKEVRALTGLGLKEAKELVEGFPKTIQKDLKPEAAQELKTKLEAIGAKVELS
jgi:large subunit ribosomal protein L7/L12